MTGSLADTLGLIGSAVFIGGFAYANLAKRLDKLWFNLVNLVGSVLLLISLSVHFNLAATVMEAAWGLIALVGALGELRRRQAGRRPAAGPEPRA